MLSPPTGSAQNDGFPPSGSTGSEIKIFLLYKNSNYKSTVCDRVLPTYNTESWANADIVNKISLSSTKQSSSGSHFKRDHVFCVRADRVDVE